MSNDFSKVSLGFAEFISQLIHETFDAILDSQSYQLDKYSELQNVLNMSNTVFRKSHISDAEFINFQIETLGFLPKRNSILTQENIAFLKAILGNEDFIKSTRKDYLTDFGFNLLEDYCVNKFVDSKKSKLRTLLNHPELARLIVDSGEIKAKLELFCLNESIQQVSNPQLTASKEANPLPNIQKTNFDITELKFDKFSNVRVREIFDKQTSLKTLLIDRTSFPKSNYEINTIPTTRLIANPITSSGSTNIFSEVTIKFKLL